MDFEADFVRYLWLLAMLPCVLVVMTVAAPDLATHLRGRLRELLALHKRRQSDLATALGVSNATVSVMLKSPRALQATMTLDRIGITAQFFDITVGELLLGPGESQHTLAEDEVDILEQFRLLPSEQRKNLRAFLRFVFQVRRDAMTDRIMARILRQNIERQLAEPPTRRVR